MARGSNQRGGSRPAPPDPVDHPAPSPEVPSEGSAYGRAEHSFTLQCVMELQKSVVQLATKVDMLIEGDKKQSEKLERVERSVDRFKTAILTVSGISVVALPAIIGMFWWLVGDRINDAVKAIKPPTIVVNPPAVSPPPVQPATPTKPN